MGRHGGNDDATAVCLKQTSPATNNNAPHDERGACREGSVSLVAVIDSISDSMQAALQQVLDTYGGPSACIQADNNNSDTLDLVQQLTWSRQAERALRQKVAALEATNARLDDAIALHHVLRAKLKDELVHERLVTMDLRKELDACVGKLENAKSSSPEYLGDVWSTAKSSDSARPAHSDTTSIESSAPSSVQPTPLYHFYDPRAIDEDEFVHRSSASSPLSSSRHSLMDQYLPSTLLLDSPCIAPQPPPKPQANSPSTDKSAFSLNAHDEANSSPPPPAPTTAPASLHAPTLTGLCDLFPDIPVADVHAAFVASQSDAAATIDALVHSHKSFRPQAAVAPRPASTPPAPAALNWKTELCVYFLQGKCNKTRRTCSFAHGESDLLPRQSHHASSSTLKTRLCPLYLDGGSCPRSRRDCPHAHGEADLVIVNGGSAAAAPSAPPPGLTASNGPPLPPPLPVQVPHHAHPMMGVPQPPSSGGALLGPRLQNYKTEMCFYYLKGCCNYSTEECRFAHGDTDLRTIESNAMHQGAVVDWGADRKAMAYEGAMNLQHQLLYQQQAPSSRASGVLPPPPPSMYPRYMAKDELTKRRATIPARRESMNAMPSTWSIAGGATHQQSPIDY